MAEHYRAPLGAAEARVARVVTVLEVSLGLDDDA